MIKCFWLALLTLLSLAAGCTNRPENLASSLIVPTDKMVSTPSARQTPSPVQDETSTPSGELSEAELPPIPPGCTAVSKQFSTENDQSSIFPAVSPADWSKGPEAPAVTLIEYSDFQCPACANLTPVLKLIQEKYPDDVRLVFRHFPLIGTPERPLHDKAALAAQAAEAAGLQGKFWEMHDQLFGRQDEWTALSQADFRTWLDSTAISLSLDLARFHQDLDSEPLVMLAQSAWDWGLQVGLPGTPFVLINGKPWDFNVPLTEYNLSVVVKLTLLEKRQFNSCPPMQIDPQKEYIVTLQTEKGDIILELFPDKAPLAVNNFVFLIRNGWYDNVTFHRVIPNFVAQAGDPSGTGFGGPGYAFANEIVAGLEFDREGRLAMANAGEGSNGSQFFITYGPAENLNGRYTIFGQVIEGMDVLRSLTPRDTDKTADLPPGDSILKATVEEK